MSGRGRRDHSAFDLLPSADCVPCSLEPRKPLSARTGLREEFAAILFDRAYIDIALRIGGSYFRRWSVVESCICAAELCSIHHEN